MIKMVCHYKLAAVVIIAILLPSTLFGQELSVSASAKSGIYWEESQTQGRNADEKVLLHSKDDAGNGQGRFRLDVEYTVENMGAKTRIQWDEWRSSSPNWEYAFVYGNFFNDQLAVSVGKLGSSPWGTGGPEMWTELEISQQGGGMRTEYKPYYVPGLNVGFVLNYFNHPGDQGWPASKPFTLTEILKETVLGVSYTHDMFLARFAFRFDSEADAIAGNTGGMGEEMYVFRVEERVLDNFLPGFQIWALGRGIAWNAPQENSVMRLENWLFAQYNPKDFTAQIRFGYDYTDNRSILHFKPSFYWKFFDNLLNTGISFWYGQDFGEGKVYKGSPFTYIELEPRLQLNFGSSSYIAFAYNFRREYVHEMIQHDGSVVGPMKGTQWMNLRFCLAF